MWWSISTENKVSNSIDVFGENWNHIAGSIYLGPTINYWPWHQTYLMFIRIFLKIQDQLLCYDVRNSAMPPSLIYHPMKKSFININSNISSHNTLYFSSFLFYILCSIIPPFHPFPSHYSLNLLIFPYIHYM